MVRNCLRKWRERQGTKGISKAHLARRIGVSRSYVTKLESGALQPSARVMFRIAEYFGCHVDDIFRNEDTAQ